MNCPQCAIPLHGDAYERQPVSRCPRCDGTWLAKGDLERIQEAHLVDHSVQHRLGTDTVERSVDMARQRALPPRTCPKCGDPMERREYGLASQVLIDACPHGDGLWLDAGELEAVELYFERVRAEGSAESGGITGLFASLWFAWKP